ncbi:MAG: hypothetical protein IPK31_15845 [Chitinophagaceae bacterium]|nr:hypothetical protein [Chitinophagaceae bacterium]
MMEGWEVFEYGSNGNKIRFLYSISICFKFSIASIDIDGAESKVTIFSNKTSQINNTVPDKGGISAGAREAQTRLEVINWLLPKLKVPSTLYSDMLTPEEKVILF